MTYRLLTNITEVSINNIRLHCHSILLEPGMTWGSEQSTVGRIRGFISDGALPVFTYQLRCDHLDYELKSGSSQNMVMLSDDGPRPMFNDHQLTFGDKTVFTTTSEFGNSELEITDYEELTRVWEEMPRKVAAHWSAPNMPVRCYVPAASVRG